MARGRVDAVVVGVDQYCWTEVDKDGNRLEYRTAVRGETINVPAEEFARGEMLGALMTPEEAERVAADNAADAAAQDAPRRIQELQAALAAAEARIAELEEQLAEALERADAAEQAAKDAQPSGKQAAASTGKE